MKCYMRCLFMFPVETLPRQKRLDRMFGGGKVAGFTRVLASEMSSARQ